MDVQGSGLTWDLMRKSEIVEIDCNEDVNGWRFVLFAICVTPEVVITG